MVDIARANLYGQPVGTFRWDNNRQLAHFEYADSFIGKGLEPSPILMPVRQGRIYSFSDIGRDTFKGLPGMLADSLPDTYGRALFDRWLALTGRSSGNAVGHCVSSANAAWEHWSMNRPWMLHIVRMSR